MKFILKILLHILFYFTLLGFGVTASNAQGYSSFCAQESLWVDSEDLMEYEESNLDRPHADKLYYHFDLMLIFILLIILTP